MESLRLGIFQLAKVHRCYNEPGDPTIYYCFVVLTDCNGQLLAQSPFYQAAIYMKGVKAVLNIK